MVEGFPKSSEIKNDLNNNQIQLKKISDFILKFEDIVKSKKQEQEKLNKKGNIK